MPNTITIGYLKLFQMSNFDENWSVTNMTTLVKSFIALDPEFELSLIAKNVFKM